MSHARITFRRSDTTYLRNRRSYAVNRAGERIATIAMLGNGQWYWYGGGQNTSHRPTTLEACKEEVKRHFAATAPNPKGTA